jgi:hypothetical protein
MSNDGEKMDIPGQEWRAKEGYASDFDAYGKFKKRRGYKDLPWESNEKYRSGWDRIFGKRKDDDPPHDK